MCGICGFTGRPDPALLRAMTASLRHRGPDDEGFHESGAASLGFRRLAIIDLDTGAQPMSTDGGRLHIVFNGEIYNYRELRAELEARGRTLPHPERHRGRPAGLRGVGPGGVLALQRHVGHRPPRQPRRRAAAGPLPRPLRHQAALLRRARRSRGLRLGDQGDPRGPHLPPPGRRAAALRVPRLRPLRPQRPHLLRGRPPGGGGCLRRGRPRGRHPRDPLLDAGARRGRRSRPPGVPPPLHPRRGAAAGGRRPGRHLPLRRPGFVLHRLRDGPAAGPARARTRSPWASVSRPSPRSFPATPSTSGATSRRCWRSPPPTPPGCSRPRSNGSASWRPGSGTRRSR